VADAGGDKQRSLRAEELAAEPMVQFRRWYAEAQDAAQPEPEVLNLATVGPDGVPSSRFVLLKAADERGFTFYSNYRSRKGCDIDGNPVAALAFRWWVLDRQVRAVGVVEVTSPEESDAYFASRARESQLGAWASEQSQVIASRSVIEDRLADLEIRFAGVDVPRPPWWGGLRVVPTAVEFWQSRPSRLHDRFRYARDGKGWRIDRLAP
jgi:pyridoxamine 5'-phosphate oxidase